MNSSARPGICAIRALLERWFSHLPAIAQPDVKGRFCSARPADHEGAFFELYWHELLTCSGYTVQIHPTVTHASTNPDFLTLLDKTPQFYLEATIAMPPNDIAADRRFAELHDTLNRMDSPDYFLGIEYRGNPRNNMRGRVIQRRLQRWLCELDRGEVSLLYREQRYDELPRLTLEEHGCFLTFTPIPKGPQLRGQLGVRSVGIVMPTEMQTLSTHEDIRAAIEGKATKYGELDLPLVVAVNVLNDFCDRDDIWNALFGEEQIQVTRHEVGNFDHKYCRMPNGAWRGRAGARNQLVSAVCVTHQLSPSSLRSSSVDLVHNPWAFNLLPATALASPQLTISVPDGHIHPQDGRDHADLLGIPTLWPVPD
jgi:hypothetical protein